MIALTRNGTDTKCDIPFQSNLILDYISNNADEDDLKLTKNQLQTVNITSPFVPPIKKVGI